MATRQFRYIGDPKEKNQDGINGGPRVTKAYGHTFEKNGPPVEVSTEQRINEKPNAPLVVDKLSRNDHFAEVGAAVSLAKEVSDGGDEAGTQESGAEAFGRSRSRSKRQS